MSALRSLASLTKRAGARSFSAAPATSALPAYVAGAPEAVVTFTAGGLKIASITTPGETATVTAWVEAGSRFETPETNGVANLLESSAMASKANEIAAIGGMVSSYTSREFIVFEAKVLKEHVGAATALLGELVAGTPADVAANGAKAAMLATLEATKTCPEEVLFEHLHDAAYLDTPMGMSVLGTPETVSALTAADVVAFQQAYATAGRTVVAASGAVDGPAFAAAAAAAFGALPAGSGADHAVATLSPATFTGSDKRIRFDSKPAAYVALAFQGASHGSPDALPLMVMGAYLGGFDAAANGAVDPKNLTSKLSTDQGEQQAASALKVINASYKDSGLFGVYFSAPDNRVEDAMWYTLWNLVRLVHKTSDADVAFAKVQLKAALLAERSTTAGSAAALAKDLACVGRPVTLKELFARVDAVTAADVKAVAAKVVNDQDHALAAAGAIYELPDYNWIRRRSHWLRY